MKFVFKSKINPRQGCECVLLPYTRFSYLLLWDQVECSPLLGRLKQVLCIGPHLLWSSSKYVGSYIIFIKKKTQTKHTHTHPPTEISPIIEIGQDLEKGEKLKFSSSLPMNLAGWIRKEGKKGNSPQSLLWRVRAGPGWLWTDIISVNYDNQLWLSTDVVSYGVSISAFALSHPVPLRALSGVRYRYVWDSVMMNAHCSINFPRVALPMLLTSSLQCSCWSSDLCEQRFLFTYIYLLVFYRWLGCLKLRWKIKPKQDSN